MNLPISTKEFRPVRWPFRFLAAGVVLAGGVAILGCAWAAFAGQAAPRHGTSAEMIASLPGAAWLLNMAWSAAVRGRAPGNDHWPFASDRVLSAYLIIMYFVYWH